MTGEEIQSVLSTEVEHALAAVLGGEQAVAESWICWVNYIDADGHRRWAFLNPEGQYPDVSMLLADLASMHATEVVRSVFCGDEA
jgi:hypothetical protein